MRFLEGRPCPDDNLPSILSVQLKFSKYLPHIKIWAKLKFGRDRLRTIFLTSKTQNCLSPQPCEIEMGGGGGGGSYSFFEFLTKNAKHKIGNIGS